MTKFNQLLISLYGSSGDALCTSVAVVLWGRSFHPASQEIFQIRFVYSPFSSDFHCRDQLLGNHFSHLLLRGLEQRSSLGHGEKFGYAHGSSSFRSTKFFSAL